ncbi:DUF3108 domain-containing protein, partial [Massilia sp. 2TAF26]|uniref:DUF3108 domain-containing protein n=1 Tax=Massilia sp. 2TAF26 TaxID=3233012 RepID=UPI003F97035C
VDTAAAPHRPQDSRPAQAADRPVDAAPEPTPRRPPAPPPAAAVTEAPPPAGVATPAITGPTTRPAPAASPGENALLPMAGRYRLRLPASARLSFTSPGRADGQAYLDWRSDDSGYSLEFDGILGRLSSRGISGDTGIAPALATEIRADGSTSTSFDATTGEVRFQGAGNPAPGAVGMQDRASVLVQLAAIALGRPEQLQNEIRIVVAGASQVGVERYQVLGQEEVDTGIGSMPAWHLARLAAPGEARLELWLAPSQDWLPVQLRLSGTDGRVETQTLSGAVRAAPAP